jgi:hypothetical protein
MLNSDLKFLNEEFVKSQKSYQSELDKSKNLKIELEQEIQKRLQLQQDNSDMLNENSNLKIKEKQLTNQIKDLNEECLNIKLECENLRKLMVNTENYYIKSIQEELDELKQMNQLYRSQRLELGEENEMLFKERDRFKQDINQIQKEKDNLSQLLEQQIARAETEQSAHYLAEQKLISFDKEIMLLKHNQNENKQKYTNEIQIVSFDQKNKKFNFFLFF